MLTLWGDQHRFCDRVNRRDFLRVGALGLGGLALPDLLRLRAESGSSSSPRAVIMVCLAGGPSHMDMYDLKPNAPADFRGEFRPIRTNVPGFDICEHMPLQAKIADKLALVRTVQFVEPMQHELEEVYTGFPKSAKRPSFGSVVSRFRGGDSKLPSYVSLDYNTRHRRLRESAIHRGGPSAVAARRHRGRPQPEPALVHDPGRGWTTAVACCETFDTFRRDIDTRRESRDMDAYTARAFDIITSPKAREAFDLSREPDRVRDRYGRKDDKYIYVGTKPDTAWEGAQVPAGPPTGRGRRAGGDPAGRRLGPSRQRRFVGRRHDLEQPVAPPAAAGPLDPRPGHRPARARAGQGSGGAGLGRVRPDAEDFAERPRSLAGRRLRPVRRRRQDRAGGRRNRQPRRTAEEPRRSARRTSSARSITRWASTRSRS